MFPAPVTVHISFICAVLLSVASGVSSPAAPDEDPKAPHRFPSCAASSYCTPIRKCSSFEDGWMRKGVGITCGHGSGPYRRVCCPRIHGKEVPARQTNRFAAITATNDKNAGCGVRQRADWLENDIKEDDNEMDASWPWLAAIEVREYSDDPARYLCTGSLIDKRHVLTVAHCFQPLSSDPSRYTIHVGSDVFTSGKVYPVIEIKTHEDYERGSSYNDIALLTLAEEVDVPGFAPVCLPDEGKDLTRRGTTLAGWGTEDKYKQVSDRLKQVDGIRIVSNEHCEDVYRGQVGSFQRKFPRGMTGDVLCAEPSTDDLCWGNSGSPLMILNRKRWFVVGLSSFGFLCGRRFLPSGYTNVSTYVEWIRQNIKN